MKRYYLADVITFPGPFGMTYGLAVSAHGVNHTAVIPTGPDGIPLHPWGLALVDTPDHTALRADPRLDALPDVALDTRVSAISGPAQADLTTKLARRGIPSAEISAQVRPDDGYRALLQVIGRRLDATFTVDRFDVSG